MTENESGERQACYRQIVADTEGMTQEERWDYYDANSGSQQIVWEFRHKNAASQEIESFEKAAGTLGLTEAVEAIDQATEALGPGEYVQWLNTHPSAKEALIKINKLRDSYQAED